MSVHRLNRFGFRLLKQKRRGQTLVEFVLYVFWSVTFIVFLYYLNSVFEISQKQTMLLRTQAFMELGGHSFFGVKAHGKDDPNNKQDRIAFVLGKKTQMFADSYYQDKTVPDLEGKDLEVFRKAVEGKLEVEVNRATRDDYFWQTFRFPKAETRLVWYEDSKDKSKPTFEIPLRQLLAIQNGRNINVNSGSPSIEKTGLFSGSVQMNDVMDLMQFSQNLTQQRGLIDDLDPLRAKVRQLVKNDSSLSQEAEALEKSLSAADGLQGGGTQALIATAIQVAVAVALDQLGGLMDKGGDAAESGADAAASNTGFSNLMDQMTSPITQVQNAVNGTVLSAPMQAVFSPVMNVANGLSTFSNGLVRGTAGAWLGSNGALMGLSQIGQGVATGAGYAGTSWQELSMVTAALSIPGSLDAGVEKFGSSLHNVNTDKIGDMVGAVSSMVAPVTQLTAMLAPEMAVPLSYVNQGLQAANAVTSLASASVKLSDGSLGDKKLPEVLKTVGTFTVAAGGLYSTVAAIAGKDPMPGAYIAMAGGAMIATGGLVQLAQDMKAKGISLGNPVNWVKEVGKKNVENARNSLEGFKNTMSSASKNISANMAMAFKADRKIENSDAKSIIKNIASLDKKTTTGVDYLMNGVSKESLSQGNLINAEDRLKEMRASVILNMKYQGADPDKIDEVNAQFDEVQKSIADLKAFKNNPNARLDTEALAKASSTAEGLKDTLSKYFEQDPSNKNDEPVYEASNRQVKALRGHTSQVELEKLAVQEGRTYDEIKAMEAEKKAQGGWKGFTYNIKTITGGNRTLAAEQEQMQKARDLMTIANAYDKAIERKQQIKTTMNALKASQGIATEGPLVTENRSTTRYNASRMASILESELESNPADYSPRVQAEIKQEIEKLRGISEGDRELYSYHQYLTATKAKVDELNKVVKQQTKKGAELLAERCSKSGC